MEFNVEVAVVGWWALSPVRAARETPARGSAISIEMGIVPGTTGRSTWNSVGTLLHAQSNRTRPSGFDSAWHSWPRGRELQRRSTWNSTGACCIREAPRPDQTSTAYPRDREAGAFHVELGRGLSPP